MRLGAQRSSPSTRPPRAGGALRHGGARRRDPRPSPHHAGAVAINRPRSRLNGCLDAFRQFTVPPRKPPDADSKTRGAHAETPRSRQNAPRSSRPSDGPGSLSTPIGRSRHPERLRWPQNGHTQPADLQGDQPTLLEGSGGLWHIPPSGQREGDAVMDAAAIVAPMTVRQRWRRSVRRIARTRATLRAVRRTRGSPCGRAVPGCQRGSWPLALARSWGHEQRRPPYSVVLANDSPMARQRQHAHAARERTTIVEFERSLSLRRLDHGQSSS